MGSPQRYIAADGTPQYVIWAEQWLVGSALLADAAMVPGEVRSVDFHDETLGVIWGVVADLAARHRDPIVSLVAAVLAEQGVLDEVGAEPYLAALASDELAYVYCSRAAMQAHADLITQYGARRRRIAELAREARGVSEGKIIPASHRFTGGVSFEYVESPLARQP